MRHAAGGREQHCAGITTGLLNTHYVLLPIPSVIGEPRTVNTAGRKWNRLLTSIVQPDLK